MIIPKYNNNYYYSTNIDQFHPENNNNNNYNNTTVLGFVNRFPLPTTKLPSFTSTVDLYALWAMPEQSHPNAIGYSTYHTELTTPIYLLHNRIPDRHPFYLF
jgi:hypothetical protein